MAENFIVVLLLLILQISIVHHWKISDNFQPIYQQKEINHDNHPGIYQAANAP